MISKGFILFPAGPKREIPRGHFSRTGSQLEHSVRSVLPVRGPSYRVFSHDVTAAILVSQNNETAAMLVSQTNPLGVELFSYANALFCSDKFA